MQLAEFRDRLNDTLTHDAYTGADASVNGLQVGRTDTPHSVDHAAFAVDGVAATIQTAATADADVLVVHHGIIWDGVSRVVDTTYDRIAALIDNDVALYVSHLPLDGHDEYGNAARLAKFLECDIIDTFGEYHDVTVGQQVRASEPLDIASLRDQLDTLDTADRPVHVLDFGPDTIEDIAIVTGAGTDWIHDAAAIGMDALITGEGKQQAYHDAREAGINVFLAGHYATETFGVKALQDLVNSWGLTTTFIDHPTGL